MYSCVVSLSKTAAGTAGAVVNLRFGTNASTADTSRGSYTFVAGTAAADTGTLRFDATFRTVGSGTSAVVTGVAQIMHKLAVTGLTGTAASSQAVITTSGGFDSTVANSYIGLSLNAGASAAWTIDVVNCELKNLN
jgi:hypothetical protein